MFRELVAAVEPVVSTGELLKNVEALRSTDRWFTFPKFMETALYIRRRLKDAGLRAEILEHPADGRTAVGDWVMPLAWDAGEATLTLLAPDARAGEVLARRSECPPALCMYSAPTPAGGVECDLLDVDETIDAVGKGSLEADRPQALARALKERGLAGHAAFTRRDPRNIKAAVAHAGGIGIVSAFSPDPEGLPEETFWVNGWSDRIGGWVATAHDSRLWGFMLTPRGGEGMAALLAAGGVRVRAEVDARLYEGVLPLVSGLLAGETADEVLCVGHVFEQGANDNASGGSAMLEAARVLARLVERGALPRPRRGIRFLFVQECYGTLAYAVGNAARLAHTAAALNLDCVGENQRLCRMPMPVNGCPHANPSVAETAMLRLCEEYLHRRDPYFAWYPERFSLGDTLIADPAFGVPCVYLGGKDRFWHTTADTLDKIDPDALALVTVVSAVYLHALASAGRREAAALGEEAAARARGDLARLASRFAARLADVSGGRRAEVLREAAERLAYLRDVRIAQVHSAVHLAARDERLETRGDLREPIRRLRRAAREEGAHLARLARRFAAEAGEPEPVGAEPAEPAPAGALARVPVRLVAGPVSLDTLSDEELEGRPSPRWSGKLTSALFWCDGRRKLAEVLRLARLETGRPTEDLAGDFEFLERRGLVELRDRPGSRRMRRKRASG